MYLETVYFVYIEDITLLGQNLDIKHFNMKYFCESYGFIQNFCRVLQKIVLCASEGMIVVIMLTEFQKLT